MKRNVNTVFEIFPSICYRNTQFQLAGELRWIDGLVDEHFFGINYLLTI